MSLECLTCCWLAVTGWWWCCRRPGAEAPAPGSRPSPWSSASCQSWGASRYSFNRMGLFLRILPCQRFHRKFIMNQLKRWVWSITLRGIWGLCRVASWWPWGTVWPGLWGSPRRWPPAPRRSPPWPGESRSPSPWPSREATPRTGTRPPRTCTCPGPGRCREDTSSKC